MCTTCGCSEGDMRIEDAPQHASDQNPSHGHGHHHDHHPDHSQDHPPSHADKNHPNHEHLHIHHHDAHHHGHVHDHAHDHNHDDHPPAIHDEGPTHPRRIRLEQDILTENQRYADTNRTYFTAHGVLALNLVSSPGAGKTSLLVATLKALHDVPMAVIEGDQQTSQDAERIRATGTAAIQINTGKGCHLDAHTVGHALERLALPDGGVLFIENVGNLVCPAGFDLGEACKVVILSVTEGDDKPLKYPDMFAASQLMILHKTDLLPYVDFNVQQCLDYAHRINPHLEVLQVSSRTGDGLEAWLTWVKRRHQPVLQHYVEKLSARLASLQSRLQPIS